MRFLRTPSIDLRRRADRRAFLTRIGALAGAVPFAGLARQPEPRRVRRIGFLIGGEQALIDAFKDTLREHGYIEGENLRLELRIAAGPEIAKYALELATSDLELVVAAALPQALEIRKANPAMPMVIATCPGMISNGFAKSFEHPGGNVTGMDELPPGVTAKRLTLLKTAAPNISRIGLLSTTPGRGGHEAQLAEAQEAAQSLGVSVKPYRAASLAELPPALAALVSDGMNGLANFQGGLSLANRKLIVDFAAQQKLPAVYQATLFAEAGGLMAWAPNLEEQFRVAAGYVDQILKGAKPGDLPIRHPARYFLTINASAARHLGLTLPPALLAEADRILP
jgi:putative tryptophan/tyrosine transport system substrate-binding protein